MKLNDAEKAKLVVETAEKLGELLGKACEIEYSYSDGAHSLTVRIGNLEAARALLTSSAMRDINAGLLAIAFRDAIANRQHYDITV